MQNVKFLYVDESGELKTIFQAPLVASPEDDSWLELEETEIQLPNGEKIILEVAYMVHSYLTNVFVKQNNVQIFALVGYGRAPDIHLTTDFLTLGGKKVGFYLFEEK